MDALSSPYAAGVVLPSLGRALPRVDMRRIEQAYLLAERLYGDALLPMGEISLLEHVNGVLAILLEFCPEEDAIIACLLQHALLRKGYSLQQLEEQFGKTVRTIVARLHLLSHINSQQWQRSVDDMKIMLVSLSDDTRIILLYLSAQCYLLNNIERIAEANRVRIAREALQIFAPVAARLGIYVLKNRLEDRAFPICYPTDAERIHDQLASLHANHGAFLPVASDAMRDFLQQEGMRARVVAREKHYYSAFGKMRRKSLMDIAKITDLFAIRVIVQTPEDCYQVLGLLHRIARPVPHRFKDYIAFPKPNGYQSLHTCLLGLPHAPSDLMVEVQIRTEDMHREAEYGIAAHWMYKEDAAARSTAHSLKLSDILSTQQFVESDDQGDGRDIRFVDHIYALTPRGDIRELPDGATPLDFAFLVHTDIGLKYKGARVNGSIVPLTHRLDNGDIVEILTHADPRPSLQWLDKLATSSAKSKLKNYFFSHRRDEFLSVGRRLLNLEFASKKLPPLDNDLTALRTFDGVPQSMHEREDLLVKIGMGSIKTASVPRHLPLPRTIVKKVRAVQQSRKRALIVIDGAPPSTPFRFAKCCAVHEQMPRPMEIIGFVTRAGDMSIHRKGCGMLKTANRGRMVGVQWAA